MLGAYPIRALPQRLTWAIVGGLLAVTPAFSQQPAAAPQQNGKVEISTFDGWTVTCQINETAATKRACSAQLRIFQTDPTSKMSRAVFGWVAGMRDKRLISVFQLPTGVLIQPGVQLQVGKDTRTLAYSQCDPNGCEAVVPLDDGFIKAASAVPAIDATIVGIDGKGLKFSINMKGFEKMLAELRK